MTISFAPNPTGWTPPIIEESVSAASAAPWIQPGSGYRYLTTSVLTGQMLGDWLPMIPQSFSRQLSGPGAGSCALQLVEDPVRNAANLAAVTPRKSVLWVLQQDAVVWNGIIWDWAHQSILDGTLPLNCASMESILSKRVINTTISFAGTDIFDMARQLVGYALGKTPNGLVAGLTYSAGECGITDSLSFAGSQRQTVADALGTLVTTYEIEYSMRPYQDQNGDFLTSLDLGYPALGQPFPGSRLVYNFPGNVQDYGFTATGSTSFNRVLGTATSSDASGNMLTGRATDMADTGAGYPLCELAVSASSTDWTTDDQVLAYATGYLPQVTGTQLTPLITLPGGAYPAISDTVLGSWAQVAFTSRLHPSPEGSDGAPGFSGTGRVTGWTLTPPSAGNAETSQIQMGSMALLP